MTEVELSTGKVEIRRLGLFELDDKIAKNIPGPLTYTVEYASGPVEEVIDISKPRKEPSRPFSEVEEGGPDYYDWQEWHRYQAALRRREEQFEAMADYARRCADYIRRNCIDDAGQIITPEDWQAVYHAAFNPLVSQEDIAAAMRDSFRSGL